MIARAQYGKGALTCCSFNHFEGFSNMKKNIKTSNKFLYYLMTTSLIQDQIMTEVVGSTIPTISQTKVLNFQIVLPPRNEVDSIVEHIDKSLRTLDESNQQILTQIQKLLEYRQSIISEAVTGKVDVREWQKPKPIN